MSSNNSPPINSDPQDDFWRIVNDISQITDSGIGVSRDFHRQFTRGNDFALKLRANSGNFPPNADYSTINPQLARYRDELRSSASALNALHSAAGSATAYTNATAIYAVIDGAFLFPNMAQVPQPGYLQARESLFSLVIHPHQAEQILERMKVLGFEKREDGIQAINLFRTAWDTYSTQQITPTPSLFSMRQAVHRTVNVLGHMCRPGISDKESAVIMHIGKHLASPHTTERDFEEIRDMWVKAGDKENLSNLVSGDGTKHGTYSRQEEHDLIGKCMILMTRLLNAVDPKKLPTL